MKTALIARHALVAALLIPMIATAGVVITAEPSFAQTAGTPGGGNGGNGGRGGRSDTGQDGSSAMDVNCLAAPCSKPRPPRRRPPVQSVSIAPDCSCELRTVRSGGQFVRVKDCYKIVNQRMRYCQPLAQ